MNQLYMTRTRQSWAHVRLLASHVLEEGLTYVSIQSKHWSRPFSTTHVGLSSGCLVARGSAVGCASRTPDSPSGCVSSRTIHAAEHERWHGNDNLHGEGYGRRIAMVADSMVTSGLCKWHPPVTGRAALILIPFGTRHAYGTLRSIVGQIRVPATLESADQCATGPGAPGPASAHGPRRAGARVPADSRLAVHYSPIARSQAWTSPSLQGA